MNRSTLIIEASTVLFLALGLGCDDEVVRNQTRGSGGPVEAAEGDDLGDDEGAKPLVPLVYRDEDFMESERNRDPFRNLLTGGEAQASVEVQRRVVMSTTSIAEMRLIAIIGGATKARAMLVDPLGVGHVVERGMYIGRPKVIQATGSVSMTLNWRIDRIRENEVVLTRQDPTDPSRPPLTMVIALREEAG